MLRNLVSRTTYLGASRGAAREIHLQYVLSTGQVWGDSGPTHCSPLGSLGSYLSVVVPLVLLLPLAYRSDNDDKDDKVAKPRGHRLSQRTQGFVVIFLCPAAGIVHGRVEVGAYWVSNQPQHARGLGCSYPATVAHLFP